VRAESGLRWAIDQCNDLSAAEQRQHIFTRLATAAAATTMKLKAGLFGFMYICSCS